MALRERERLKQSEARFRALVDAATDFAIYLLDEEGRVATWSPGAERIKGYREADVIDRDFSMFYPPEDVAAGKPRQELEAAAANGHFQVEGWRLRSDGTRFLADVVITPVRDDDGELIGYAKVTRDVTDRKREQDYERERRTIEEREQIAALLHRNAITLLFEAGLELQGLALRRDDPVLRNGLESVVAKLDEAIRQLRAFVFHPDQQPPR